MSERKNIIRRITLPEQNSNGVNGDTNGNHVFSTPLDDADHSFEAIFGEPLDPSETAKPKVYLKAVINIAGQPAQYYDTEKKPQDLELPFDTEVGTIIVTQNPTEIFGQNRLDKMLVLEKIIIEHPVRKTKSAHFLVTPRQNTTYFKLNYGSKIPEGAKEVKLEEILNSNPKAEGQTLSPEEIEAIYKVQNHKKITTTAQFNSLKKT